MDSTRGEISEWIGSEAGSEGVSGRRSRGKPCESRRLWITKGLELEEGARAALQLGSCLSDWDSCVDGLSSSDELIGESFWGVSAGEAILILEVGVGEEAIGRVASVDVVEGELTELELGDGDNWTLACGGGVVGVLDFFRGAGSGTEDRAMRSQ